MLKPFWFWPRWSCCCCCKGTRPTTEKETEETEEETEETERWRGCDHNKKQKVKGVIGLLERKEHKCEWHWRNLWLLVLLASPILRLLVWVCKNLCYPKWVIKKNTKRMWDGEGRGSYGILQMVGGRRRLQPTTPCPNFFWLPEGEYHVMKACGTNASLKTLMVGGEREEEQERRERETYTKSFTERKRINEFVVSFNIVCWPRQKVGGGWTPRNRN